jgi:hypothetical protein
MTSTQCCFVKNIFKISRFSRSVFSKSKQRISTALSHYFIVYFLRGMGKVVFRVSFEKRFDWKQPKLEPKLVSALSEIKRLFRLFRFYIETERFDVSIEPKQTEDHRNSLIGSIFWYFDRKFRVFPVFPVCFETVCFGCLASIPKQRVSMFRLKRNKQKTNLNSLIESIFFSEYLGLFRFVPVCFETVLFVSVVTI